MGCYLIHEEIMQIGKHIHLNIYGSLGRQRMKIQETSKDFTKRGILFPCSKTTYIEANT
jgi:hypothetical protein